jgi:hypothetical protein
MEASAINLDDESDLDRVLSSRERERARHGRDVGRG